MEYTSNIYITVAMLYTQTTLDSKDSSFYLQPSNGGPSGAPRQFIATLNMGVNKSS